MLKEGESETIADYQNRFVFSPKSPSPYIPYFKPEVLNACVRFIKAVGKI